jgi:hypothetical protein
MGSNNSFLTEIYEFQLMLQNKENKENKESMLVLRKHSLEALKGSYSISSIM